MKMLIFVKTLDSRTIGVSVDGDGTVADLMAEIHEKEGIPVDQQHLVFAGKPLEHRCALADYFISNESSVDLVCGGLKGGSQGNFRSRYPPTLLALAAKYQLVKQICRKCYARLPPRAHNCRKKKCGHSNQLRKKHPFPDRE